MNTPALLLAAQTELGECPVWDAERGTLYFMDIIRQELHAYDWASGAHRILPMPALGGALALAEDGRLIAGLQSGIHMVDPATSRFDFVTDPEPDKPDHRLNEGKCDPQGRFWVGSISTLGRFPTGCLYRLGADGQATCVLDQISVPNTLAWNPAGDRMLFADSVRKQIWVFRYDAVKGEISDRETFIDCSDFKGMPDGIAVDAEGGLWVAEFGGGAVHHYAADGTHLDRISLPATQVTSCAFAGPDLDQLVIITTKRLLSDDDRAAQPHSGDLFVLTPGVRGLPPHRFR